MPVFASSEDIDGPDASQLIVGIGSGGGQSIVGGNFPQAIIADHGPVLIEDQPGHGTRATARSIDDPANWATGSNPMVGDASIPYATILGVGQGANAWFAVTLGAGQTLTVDVDFAYSQYGTTPWDSQVQITDSAGNQVATGLDSTPDQGGLGSFRYDAGINASRDPYVSYTAASAGIYYINLGSFSGAAPALIVAGRCYMLNVSVTGHAVTGAVLHNGYNLIDGGDGQDYLVGGDGTDTVIGGGDADILFGMGGDDTLEGGAGSDALDGGDGFDRATYEHATGGVTVELLFTGQQAVGGGQGTDSFKSIEGLIGSAYADTLTGNGEANYLRGLAGDDTLYGRGGDDVIEVTDGTGHDTIDGGDGYDTVDFSNSFAGWTFDYINNVHSNGADSVDMANVEAIVGTDYEDAIYAPAGVVLDFHGNGGDDVYYSALVEDATFDGGDGEDRLDFSLYSFSGAYAADFEVGFDSYGLILVNVEDITTGNTTDELYGDLNANVFRSGGGNDQLYGRDGNDTLEGGAGNDMLDGGDGFDWASYESAGAGVTVSLAIMTQQNTGGAGSDTLTGIEALKGSAFADSMTGNGLDNWFEGNGGNDIVLGGGGNDTFFWNEGGGNDNFDGGDGDGDILYLLRAGSGWTVDLPGGIASNGVGGSVQLANVEQVYGSNYADDLTAGLAGGSTLYGFGGDDVIRISNSLPNTAYGGDGVDTLDTTAVIGPGLHYEINLATGTTNFGETVAEFEYLVSGETNDFVTGTDGNNIIETQSGDDTIEGGLGDDILDGGAGIDTASYAGASGGVLARLGVATAQNTLSAGMDRLSGFENLTGSAYADRLIGDVQDNLLDGGVAADRMEGGNGDDRYLVDNAGDVVIEIDGKGSDTVISSVSYSLAGQYIEALTLTGDAAINGTGNSLANRIIGNAGANILVGGDGSDRLDGGGGADTLKGGLGNDVYVVDQAGDKIVENNGEGTDTVEASFTYSLAGQYIEILKLMGTGDFNGTGNSLANTMYGNAGNNTLNGAAGADTLYGGAGNDIYIVDNVGDRVFENNNEGTDTVQSSVSFTIGGQYVEIVTLTGTAAINATGNSQANILNGNNAANVLSGGGGNDQLHGGLGSDTLTGGAGADLYWFETTLGAGNVDTITDFNVADDTIYLDRTIFSAITADGALSSAAYFQGSAAHDADDRIVYDKATGKIWYDADGSGAGAAILFAQVTANTALTVADFYAVP